MMKDAKKSPGSKNTNSKRPDLKKPDLKKPGLKNIERFPSARQRRLLKSARLVDKHWRVFILKLKSELALKDSCFPALCALNLDEKTLAKASRELEPRERELMASQSKSKTYHEMAGRGFDICHSSFLLEIKKAILSPSSELPKELVAAIGQASAEDLAEFLGNHPRFSETIALATNKQTFAQAIDMLTDDAFNNACLSADTQENDPASALSAIKQNFTTRTPPPFASALKSALDGLDSEKEKRIYEKLASLGEWRTLGAINEDSLLPVFLINRLPAHVLTECLTDFSTDFSTDKMLASLKAMDIETKDFWLDLSAPPGSKRRLLFESELGQDWDFDGQAGAQSAKTHGNKEVLREFYGFIKSQLAKLNKLDECRNTFEQWLNEKGKISKAG